MTYYVYIMTNRRNGVLYIGVTNSLGRRVWEHQQGIADGFIKRHGLNQLVWYEAHSDINEAIWREKRLKTWNRAWKVRLIHTMNPEWNDLSTTLLPD